MLLRSFYIRFQENVSQWRYRATMDLNDSINARVSKQAKKKFDRRAKAFNMKPGQYLRLIIELVNQGKITVSASQTERATA